MAIRPLPVGTVTHMSPRVILAAVCGTLALAACFLLAPSNARADSSGGMGYAYNAFRDSFNTCKVSTPLFLHRADGWSTTLTVTNYSLVGTTVELRLTPLGSEDVIVRQISVPSNPGILSGILVKASDLDLGNTFAGSLSASACPNNIISMIVTHDREGSDSMTLEAVNKTGPVVFIPGVLNNLPLPVPVAALPIGPAVGPGIAPGVPAIVPADPATGPAIAPAGPPTGPALVPAGPPLGPITSTRVVVYNNATSDVSATVSYRVQNGPIIEQALPILKESAVLLDLRIAPRGLLGVRVEGPPGSLLSAAVYQTSSNGGASAFNGINTGSRQVSLPILYRRAGAVGAYNSSVRVMNLREGAVRPEITFYDRDSGRRIGPIVIESSLSEAEYADYPLSAFAMLEDNHIYSAVVETAADDSSLLPLSPGPSLAGCGPSRCESTQEIAAYGITSSATRNIDFGYWGFAPDGGDLRQFATLVFRRLQNIDSGLQIQNLTSQEATIRITFRTLRGGDVAGWTGHVAPNQAVTVYLPQVNGLANGFVGAADIASSVQVGVVATTVHYRTPGVGGPEVVPGPQVPGGPERHGALRESMY